MPTHHAPSVARRGLLLCLVSITGGSLLVAAVKPEPTRYNSEEHQLIVDRGVALVTIPASVTLPAGVALAPTTKTAYRDMVRAAKRLAVGFDTNNEGDYSRSTGKVQDNCYWSTYTQIDENRAIHVPEDDAVPDKVLNVPAFTRVGQGHPFTLGQLAALYGDYRRTTYCQDWRCYLNNFDIQKVGFNGNLLIREGTFCPDSVDAATYLQHIGSGLIPPYHTLANQFKNSVGANDLRDASWYGDEMIRIANVNDWHFASGAVAWYTGLHRLALLYVDSARSDPRHWVRALHLEANALHSLTDLFAFGHVVTNRDETSYGMMEDAGLLQNKGYLWMKNALEMGGATRSGTGRISLGALPTDLRNVASDRNDFVNSYRETWFARAKGEQGYHKEFNKSGAQVRNLRGDDFQIFGDTRLNQMRLTSTAFPVLVGAVQTSVQSLFDAYVALGSGQTVATIGAAGSSYFGALKYIPVYIASDANRYFTGRWTRYAKAVDDITGVGKVPAGWDTCQIAYLSGADWRWPDKTTTPCTGF